MSSETPSFKLWPVNSTFVCLPSALVPTSPSLYMPYLLDINARRAFEYLNPISPTTQPARRPGAIPAQQLDHLPHSSEIIQLTHCSMHSPLASKTCPDLSEPSGSVKVTISLYLGNLTYIPSAHPLHLPLPSFLSRHWDYHSHSPKSPKVH